MGATTAQRPATVDGGPDHRGRALARPGRRHVRAVAAADASAVADVVVVVVVFRRFRTAATALPAQGKRAAPHRRVATAVGRQLHSRHGSEHGRWGRGQIRSGTDLML